MNWLNVAVILIIFFGFVQGKYTNSLFGGLVDVLIFFFSAIFAIGFFREVAERFIRGFLIESSWTSYLTGFWAIFFAVFAILFTVKGKCLRRYEVITYPVVDSIGSRLCGAFSGVLAAATLIFALRMVPFPGRIFEDFRFLEKPIILQIDQLIPRCYGYFVRDRDKYDFEKFMSRYDYRDFLEWRKKEMEKRKRGPYYYY